MVDPPKELWEATKADLSDAVAALGWGAVSGAIDLFIDSIHLESASSDIFSNRGATSASSYIDSLEHFYLMSCKGSNPILAMD